MRFLPRSRRVLALILTVLSIPLLVLVGWGMSLSRNETLQAVFRREVSLDMSAPSPVFASRNPETPRKPDSQAVFMPTRIIRTAKLSQEVTSIASFEPAHRDLASRHGYLSDFKMTREEEGQRRAELVLRVEAALFEEARDAFKRLGVVKREEVSAEDVAHAYADLEARRANRRAAASRLREIIATRTGKLAEVVEVEQALSQVTEELEVMEARKRAYDQQIAFSTVRAEVFEPQRVPVPVAKPQEDSIWRSLWKSFQHGGIAVLTILAGLLQVVLFLSPFAGLGWVGYRLFRRFWKVRRQPAAPEVPPLAP